MSKWNPLRGDRDANGDVVPMNAEGSYYCNVSNAAALGRQDLEAGCGRHKDAEWQAENKRRGGDWSNL